jgi:hypothetical protein
MSKDPFGPKKNPPFPNDMNFDDSDQDEKIRSNFTGPLVKGWGFYVFWEDHFHDFIRYYVKACTNDKKRVKIELLLLSVLSPDEMKFTFRDFPELAEELKDIVVIDEEHLQKKDTGWRVTLEKNTIGKLKEVRDFIASPDMPTADKYLGKTAESMSYSHGSSRLLDRVAQGDWVGSAMELGIMLVGAASGKRLYTEREKEEFRARLLAHVKHYIIEGRIALDSFAEIVFEGTDRKKSEEAD